MFKYLLKGGFRGGRTNFRIVKGARYGVKMWLHSFLLGVREEEFLYNLLMHNFNFFVMNLFLFYLLLFIFFVTDPFFSFRSD